MQNWKSMIVGGLLVIAGYVMGALRESDVLIYAPTACTPTSPINLGEYTSDFGDYLGGEYETLHP